MEDLQKEFIPYELALKMKQLAFDEPCFGYFESQDKNLVINYNNKPLTEEQQKRPGLYTTDNRNGSLPQWAVAAPLYQQAFRWFREKYGMLCSIEFVEPEYSGEYGYKMYYKPGHLHIDHWGKGFKTYEEAELACLEKLLEIVEQDGKDKSES
jgi:hypothetical protein